MASNANTLTTTLGSSDDVMTTQEMNLLARTFAANPDLAANPDSTTEISLSRVALAFAICNQQRKDLKTEVLEKNQAIVGLNTQLTRATTLTASQQEHSATLSDRLDAAKTKVEAKQDALLEKQEQLTEFAVANTNFNSSINREKEENQRLHEKIKDLQKEAAKQKVLYEALEQDLYQTRASLEAALARESSGKKKTPNNSSSKCHPKCDYQGKGCNRDHSSS